MARSTATVAEVTRDGLAHALGAFPADGISLPNTGREALIIKNTGVEKTVTVQTGETRDGNAVAEKTITLPATTGYLIIGPFKPSVVYNQPGTGNVFVDIDSETGVTYQVIRIP